jgi:hypothetical protein
MATLAGIASIAALVSCGGRGSTSPKDYMAEANRACRDTQQQLDRIQHTLPRTANQAEKQAAALVDVSQQALDDLHRIKPPDDLKDAYRRYLAAREKAIGYIEDGRDAAAGNDPKAYAQAKRRVAAQQATRRQLALRAGLRFCSRPSVTLGGK